MPVVKQADARLNEPIDKDAPPTIYGTSLKPEYSNAALNLSVDFVKQQCALLNKKLFWHPVTVFSTLVCGVIFLATQSNFPGHANHVTGWLYQYFLMNKKELVTFFLVIIISASSVISLLSKVTEIVFKRKSKLIIDTKGQIIYGVDLMRLAQGEIEDKTALENTEIIVYRDTPIALVSILENKTLSKQDSLVMGVSTIGARRVYLKSGILEDLIDWALIRTKNYQKEHPKYKHGKSMKLLIDVYSFESGTKKTLARKGFSMIESYKLPENKFLAGVFGIKKELWGIQFHFEAKKE